MSTASREAFVGRMAEHLSVHFPDQTAALDTSALFQLIRYAIDRAASYGFVTQRDAAKYLNLTFEFGVDFDADSSQIWAQEILSDLRPDKINRLHEKACAVLETCANGD